MCRVNVLGIDRRWPPSIFLKRSCCFHCLLRIFPLTTVVVVSLAASEAVRPEQQLAETAPFFRKEQQRLSAFRLRTPDASGVANGVSYQIVVNYRVRWRCRRQVARTVVQLTPGWAGYLCRQCKEQQQRTAKTKGCLFVVARNAAAVGRAVVVGVLLTNGQQQQCRQGLALASFQGRPFPSWRRKLAPGVTCTCPL